MRERESNERRSSGPEREMPTRLSPLAAVMDAALAAARERSPAQPGSAIDYIYCVWRPEKDAAGQGRLRLFKKRQSPDAQGGLRFIGESGRIVPDEDRQMRGSESRQKPVVGPTRTGHSRARGAAITPLIIGPTHTGHSPYLEWLIGQDVAIDSLGEFGSGTP
jgi:hypothetical protein